LKSVKSQIKTVKKSFPVTEPDLKEALRKSDESYHGLFNTIRQAIYIQDHEGRFVEVNDGACAMYGYAHEEFIGRTPEFLAAPGLNDFSLVTEKIRQAFAGEPQQFEFWGRRKNGEIFPKDVHLYKGIYFGDNVLIAVATDITGQKRIEKALHESEEYYRAIINTSPDNITITDLSGTILMGSAASVAMFGLTGPTAANGRKIIEFIVPEEWERVRQALELILKTGVAIGEYHGVRTDGSVFPFEAHMSLMRDRRGNPWRLITVVRDISRRKELENSLSSALVRSHNQQQVIADISASPLVSSGKVDELARMITERAAPLLGVERAGVWIFDEPETQLACIDLFESTPRTHTSGTILRENEFRNEFAALKSAKFIKADDPLTDPRTAGYVESYLKPLRITSMLDAVIRSSGKNIGVICFEHVDKLHTWEPDECTFACQLADQIALAVINRERNRVQYALQESEAKFRFLTEKMNDIIWTTDLNFKTTYVSPSVEKILGFTQEERMQQDVTGQITPESLVLARTMLEGELERIQNDPSCPERTFNLPLEFYHKKNSTVWLECLISAIRNETGAISGIHGVSRDITERKRMEEALKESESFNRGLVENMPDYIAVYGPDGKLLYVNPASARGLEYDADTLIGTHVLTYVAEEYRDKVTAKMMARKNGGDTSPYEIDMVTKSGSRRSVIVKATPIHYQKNPAILLLLIDITDRRKAEEALKESEELFREVFNKANDAVFLHEMTPKGPGKYLLVNDVALNWLGYTKKEFLEMSPRDIVPKDIGQKLMPKIMDVLENGGYATFESVHQRKDKSTYPVEISTHIFSFRKRTVALSIARDITQRKQVQDALMASEAQLNAIIRASPISMFVIDNHHQVISWNKALESITGIPAGDTLGTDMHWKAFYNTKRPCMVDLLVDDSLEKIPELYADRWEKSKIVEGAIEATDFFPHIGKEGKWLHFMAAPIIDSGGNLIGAIETLEDITRLVKALQELKESEVRYRTLIDQLPDYVLVHRDGFLLYINPAAAVRLGYDEKMFIGKPLLPFIAPEYHDTVRKAIAQRMTEEGFPPYEIKIIASDGTYHTVLVNGSVITYEGKPASLNVLTDITTIKQAEETIRSAKEDLEKRVAERTEDLSKANVQLIAEISARTKAEQEITRSLEEKELLLREIHHRVKNNLQIVASLLNLQSRYITDSKVMESIKDSQSRVRAMALVHERIYRSHNIAEINLKEYLNFLTKQIFSFYNIPQYQIRVTVTMDDLMTNIDTVIPIGLIMNELVSNSLKHAFSDNRKGEISIECTSLDADRIRCIYHDNGTGMPAGFDWRNSETLGLRLVNNLVDQLNGKIDVDKGEGTTFIITLQQKRDPA